jgi:hypothetical protein
MGYEHVRFHVIYIQKRKGEEEDTRKVHNTTRIHPERG